MEELTVIKDNIEYYLLNMGALAPLVTSLLIIVESFLTILPIFLFISINIVCLGPFWGFILSYIAVVLGSYLAFLVVRHKLSLKFIETYIKDNKYISDLNFAGLLVILVLPYLPTSAVNVGMGLSKVDEKKYLLALIISKFFVVLFLGVMGVSIFDNIGEPKNLVLIVVVVVIIYGVIKLAEKYWRKRSNK